MNFRALFLLPAGEKEGTLKEARGVNLQRVWMTAGMVAALDLAYFLWFLFMPEGASPVERQWGESIQTIHFVSLLVMLLFFGVATWLRRRKTGMGVQFLLEALFLVWVLSLGISLATADQRVTNNITPFLVACVAVGALFHLRPPVALTIFALAALDFSLSLGLTQDDPALLLSNRINGITTCILGFGISYAFWRSFLQRRIQRVRIESQAEELARVNGELAEMAFHDPLTGLPNRRHLDERVRTEAAAARRRGTTSC